MDQKLCLPRIQVNIKTINKNGYPIDVSGQNDTCKYVQTPQFYIKYKIIFQLSSPVGGNHQDFLQLRP